MGLWVLGLVFKDGCWVRWLVLCVSGFVVSGVGFVDDD